MSSNFKALWKFICKPNNPVCTGCIIFTTELGVTNPEALEMAINLAQWNGFAYPTKDSEIHYIGKIEVSSFYKEESRGIIHLATGEY